MRQLVTQSPSRGAVPITLVTKAGYKLWEKKQSAFVRNYIREKGFEAAPGRFILLPGKDGRTAHVVACLSDPVSMWDLAGLPRQLPAGTYALAKELDGEAEAKLALGWLLGAYRFTRYKKDEPVKATLCLSKRFALESVYAMAETITLVRDVITTPAEDLGPEQLAQAVKGVAKAYGAKVREVVGEALLKQNYPAIHAVGRASHRAPRLIDLTWGNPKHPLVTLVGKGVCFDTGGLDIKTHGGMMLMRKDKSGGAIALGVARLVMHHGLPVRLRLLVPAAENAVAANAFRPSDVITMRNGLTVEVGNTDAEGRLVLADALAEAADEKPDLLIDFSSLTGATRGAIGMEHAAFFTADDALAQAFEQSVRRTEDMSVRFPLYDPYESMLQSRYADLTSSPGSSYAQTITAALFLRRFTGGNPRWMHLDFGGWNLTSLPGRPEGGEAVCVRAVFDLLQSRYAKA